MRTERPSPPLPPLPQERQTEDLICNQSTRHKARQLPVQPESSKFPLLVGQAAEPAPVNPEAQLTEQLAAVVPVHPEVSYPRLVASKVQVLAASCMRKKAKTKSGLLLFLFSSKRGEGGRKRIPSRQVLYRSGGSRHQRCPSTGTRPGEGEGHHPLHNSERT